MESVLQVLQFFAASFLGALGLGYAVSSFRESRRKQAINELVPNAPLRMRSLSGVYRSRFVGFREGNLQVGAPMMRDAFVPLRVGEPLTVEAPVENGVLIFRTEVLGRCGDSKTFLLQRPPNLRRTERRHELRTTRFAGTPGTLNGEWAELQDLSKHGASFHSFGTFLAGDVIKVEVPRFGAALLGWVLDVQPISIDSRTASVVRMRFVDEFPAIPIESLREEN